MTSPWERGAPDEISFGRPSGDGSGAWVPEEENPSGQPADEAPPVDASVRRDRLGMVLMAVVAIGALATTVIVTWVGRPAPPGETHQLGADEAACLKYGLLERRMEHSINREAQRELRLPPIPQIRERLQAEVEALDALGGEFPAADYRLIDAFARVADASVAALAEPRPGGASDYFVDGLVGRFDAVDAADEQCLDAGFDVEELAPR